MSVQQLALGFRLRDDSTFESFLPSGNEAALHNVLNLVQGQGDNYIYLWGTEGSGRSHLLQAACHVMDERSATAVYLPLKDMGMLHGDIFLGLETMNLVCIDDIDQIALASGSAKRDIEEQLFHLFNKLRANGNRLLIAGNAAANQLDIALPDLKSRLTWGLIYALHTLNDEQKLLALKLRAHARGLDLDDPVGKFLLRRCPRDMTQLFQTLELLDQASLAEQRRLTIPFVKQVLGV